MNHYDCQYLQNYLTSDFNVTLVPVNANPLPTNNETAVYQQVGNSNANVVVESISQYLRTNWVDETAAHGDKFWFNLRATPTYEVPLPNSAWVLFNEFAIWFIKGYISASVSSSDYFAITLPLNNTVQYVNNMNAYFAGLRYVNPQAVLYCIDTWGNFGAGPPPGTAQQAMDKILEIEVQQNITIDVIATQGSVRTWPNMTRDAGKILMENQISVNSLPSTIADLIGDGTDNVLTITVWDQNLMIAEILEEYLDDTLPKGLFTFVGVTQDTNSSPLLYLGRMSPIIPHRVQHQAQNMQTKYLENNKFKLFCEPFLQDILGDTFLFIDGCVSTYQITHQLVVSPQIIYVPIQY